MTGEKRVRDSDLMITETNCDNIEKMCELKEVGVK